MFEDIELDENELGEYLCPTCNEDLHVWVVSRMNAPILTVKMKTCIWLNPKI